MNKDFAKMSKSELRQYVLEHKEDLEALRSLMSRRNPQATRYNFSNLEEEKKQIEEIIKQKIQKNIES